jgi:hypothetical protein
MFLPTVLQFRDDPAALFFRGQALNEYLVIALTDWQEPVLKEREAERVA